MPPAASCAVGPVPTQRPQSSWEQTPRRPESQPPAPAVGTAVHSGPASFCSDRPPVTERWGFTSLARPFPGCLPALGAEPRVRGPRLPRSPWAPDERRELQPTRPSAVFTPTAGQTATGRASRGRGSPWGLPSPRRGWDVTCWLAGRDTNEPFSVNSSLWDIKGGKLLVPTDKPWARALANKTETRLMKR